MLLPTGESQANQWRSARKIRNAHPQTRDSQTRTSTLSASQAVSKQSETPTTRWQPFAATPLPKTLLPKTPSAPVTHFDSKVRTVAWEEVSGDAAHSIITRRETVADPFERPSIEDNAAPSLGDPFAQDDSTAADPFDIDLPEYDPADDAAEETADAEPAAPQEQLRDSFEDAFDEPTLESMNEELEEELPAGQPDAESIIRESQQSLDRELMPENLEEAAPVPFTEPDGEEPAEDEDNEEDTTQFGPRAGSRFTERRPDENIADEAEIEQRRQRLSEERIQNDKDCLEEFTKLSGNTIDKVDLSIRVEGEAGQDYPLECALGDRLHPGRSWPEITYMWKASGLCHKPLYFEQVQLERYGHSWGPYLQPVMSGVHFFGSAAMLPYSMGIRTPNECVYTLGYYRPGSCAPYMIDPLPFTWRAAFFQGMTIGAGVAIFP